ncbi:hypothetical protein LY90DRAFT_41209 [Neocallimastix californiae]|uniref:TPR-like protein n=1 Tax=Neocallimastix californiae TaxID=1754190 RepID=A0A1Y2BYD4_9FUNG|nr:hypothetical protein LY90DRAFT_41209 [Neocallimastix californiae]|eukprot:ORY39782.1 hypothetical protein LY90DRAFT_41209 [Neocallimastix californiae]
MMLSRVKPAVGQSNVTINDKKNSKIPKLETFIEQRDYVGALTLLEFIKANLNSSDNGPGNNNLINNFSNFSDNDLINENTIDLWIGYSAFHLGDYKKAMEIYLNMTKNPNCDPLIYLYLGCCYFFLGLYEEADKAAQKGPTCKLQNRLLFHLSHKFNDEKD